jgi:hypothetical protein
MARQLDSMFAVAIRPRPGKHGDAEAHQRMSDATNRPSTALGAHALRAARRIVR